jgi:hypothetical protein
MEVHVPLVPPNSSPDSSAQRIIHPSRHSPLAVFDASHGQRNWAQTGFASREMHTNFSGIMEILCRLGCRCAPTDEQPLPDHLACARLFVVPPPTGCYSSRKEAWTPQADSLFTPEEIGSILCFLRHGGRLFLSAYRFGDAFTKTNLRELIAPLGCLLNEDVVIDLHTLRVAHPLEAHFETPRDCLSLPWSLDGVATVLWRVMATFTILPGATAWPLALSPGGSCISFNRAHRQISFASLPIAVAGVHGQGRFVLVGSPHAFETGTFGLLQTADNTRFLRNVLSWLLDDQAVAAVCTGASTLPADGLSDLCRIENRGPGQATVAYLERQLRTSGVLKALNQAKWLT